jgi:acyl dehydratase
MSTTQSTPRLEVAVTELPAHVAARLGPTEWRTVSQDQVDAFADLTDDHNPVHVDPSFADQSPFGGTIVHGYFTLSLLAPLIDELLTVQGASLSINYGMDKVRFPSPVPVGSRFRASAELADVAEIERGVQIKVIATVEVDGASKPALIAECLFRHYA